MKRQEMKAKLKKMTLEVKSSRETFEAQLHLFV